MRPQQPGLGWGGCKQGKRTSTVASVLDIGIALLRQRMRLQEGSLRVTRKWVSGHMDRVVCCSTVLGRFASKGVVERTGGGNGSPFRLTVLFDVTVAPGNMPP